MTFNSDMDFLRSIKKEIVSLYDELDQKMEVAKFLSKKYPYLSGKSYSSIARSITKVLEEIDAEEDFSQIDEQTADNLEDYIEEESLLSDLEYESHYHYDDKRDIYIFFPPQFPVAISISGDKLRDIKEDYSNMTSKSKTVNEICREYGIPRKTFIVIKRILGWTHDDDPYTFEEYERGNIEEMVESAIQKKKWEFFQKFSRREQLELAKAAKNWWEFSNKLLNPFVQASKEVFESHKPSNLYISHPKDSKGRYACVTAPFDFHFGKYASKFLVGKGLEYNRNIAKNLLSEHLSNLLNQICTYPIEKFIVPIGSDFFHIDTLRGTTTAGTPQDCDGTLVEIMVGGNELMVEYIDSLRQVAPVEIYLCAGNHDYILSHALLSYLLAWYRDCDDVKVFEDRHDRVYTSYGSTLMGFSHGDSLKERDYPVKMPRESKDLWGKTTHRMFFHGHLHYKEVVDIDGVLIVRMPSLSGSDRWHHKNGYEGSTRALPAYIIHPESGCVAHLYSNVLDQ